MAPLRPQYGHFGLILPLCTSAATIGLALYQYPVFLSFSTPNNKPPPNFWQNTVQKSRGMIAALALSSTISGALAARWLRSHATLETTGVSQWYIAGAVLASIHMASLGTVEASPRFQEAAEEGDEGEMKSWLRVHTARTLLVDLPALWCFAEGIALSFWITSA